MKDFLFYIHKKFEKDLCDLKYLFFEITLDCNLTCIHCGSDCNSNNFTKTGDFILSKDQWLEFIDYLSLNFNSKEITIVITGGEPLTYVHLDEITRHLKAKGFRWGMVTNGYLLNEKRLKVLLENGITNATVSLDGLEKAHSYLRNKSGDYDKVLHAVKLINSYNIYSDVVTCVNSHNISELDKIAELLLELGVKRWRLFSILSKGRAVLDKSIILNRSQWNMLLEWISANKKKYAKRGLNINFSCEGYFKKKVDKKIRDFPYFCRAGINIAGILSDGSITGCPNISRSFIQGNILKDDFKTVWTKKYEEYRNKEIIRNGKCSKCREWKKCEGSSMHLYDDNKELIGLCHHDL